MRHRNRSAAAFALLWAASCALVPGTASAQDAAIVQTAPVAAVFALDARSERVPSEALRRALEAELGVRIDDAAVAVAGMPTISVLPVPSGNIEVSLSSRSLPRVSREVSLTSERAEERVETVAFIAANMVRNEAASLLPDLQPVGAPLPVRAAPPPTPRLQYIDPCDLDEPGVFGIDFAPGVGMSSSPLGRAALRKLSFGLVGTLSRNLKGFELSIGANIKTGGMCGLQLAYGANVVRGHAHGMQVAIANWVGGRYRGFQLGLANSTHGELKGVQAGLINIDGDDVHGMQVGLLNVDVGSMYGPHGAIVNVLTGGLHGFEAGVANVVIGNARGVQAGVANMVGGAVEGVQVGVGNYAGSIDGLQLGVANVSAGPVRGAQFGLVNYADESDASIGLLSIVRRGRTSIDLLAQPDTGILTVGITHGGKYVHNSYGFGVRAGRDGQEMVATLGLGVRVLRTSLLHIDVDAIGATFITDHMGTSNTNTAGLRVPVTFDVFRGLGLVVAPSYSVMITDDPRQTDPSAFGNKRFHDGSVRVLGYPSLTFGVRYEFDHGH